MRQETAEIVQLIGKVVKEQWPTCSKGDRLDKVVFALDCRDDICMTMYQSLIGVKVDVLNDEHVYLTIDGDLGVYYVNSTKSGKLDGTNRDPIRISLMTIRQVKVTEIYVVDVPCFETTTTEQLTTLAQDYEREYINTTYEELK